MMWGFLIFFSIVARSSSFSRVARYLSCPSSRPLSLILECFTDLSIISRGRLHYSVQPAESICVTPLPSERLVPAPAIKSARRKRWNCRPLLASNTGGEVYYDDFLHGLSGAQKDIVTADLASIRVQAGPGSGKTR